MMQLSPELLAWVGHARVVEEDVGLAATRRIAAMLDLDPGSFRLGDALPAHWFSMFFAETARQSDIGPDGHPKPGVTLPPIPLPRRMGAGRRVTLHGPIRVGEMLSRTTEVAAITPKQARTGFITVLTMRNTIRRGDEILAVDEFDAVYREAVKPGEKSAVNAAVPAPANPDWAVQKHLSETLVFRYSAITWNAHRIHYDADYARCAEGYPATVQNGGLTMQLLLDALVAHVPDTLKSFSARLTRPISVGETVRFAGHAPAAGRATAWVQNSEGAVCAQVEAVFG